MFHSKWLNVLGYELSGHKLKVNELGLFLHLMFSMRLHPLG